MSDIELQFLVLLATPILALALSLFAYFVVVCFGVIVGMVAGIFQ